VAPADGATVGFRGWDKANGFVRKGTTLRRDQAETIAVVNLQGSQGGGRYYINVALWLKILGGRSDSLPYEHECHLRTRLDDLVPDEHEVLELLDMANGIDAGERATRLQRFLDENLTPTLQETGTIALLRDHNYPSRNYWLITGPAQALLATDPAS
jgi:hypothetical protein